MRAALHGLTSRGRAFLAAGAAAVAFAVLIGQQDVLRVGVLVLVLVGATAIAVTRTRFRLAARRVVTPSRVEAGQPARVLLRLDNLGVLPTGLMLVEDRLPAELGGSARFVLDRVEPRGHRAVEYLVTTRARGRHAIGPVSIRLTDPFGLFDLRRSFSQRDLLVVTPVLETLPVIPLGGDWAGSGESRARSVATAGEDDVAVREYRHGDELRRVHWRATAKYGELMVRREEQPWESRSTVVLDTRADAHAGTGVDTSFEAAVSAAASVGVHLGRRGYGVRLAAGPGPDVMSAGHEAGTVRGENEGLLLDALAVVEPMAGGFDGIVRALRRGGGEALAVVVLGALGPEDAAQLARARPGLGSAVAIVVGTDEWLRPNDSRRPGVERDRQGAMALLEQSGWRVIPLRRTGSLAQEWTLAGRAALRRQERGA